MLDLEQYQITGSTAREIAASAEAAIRDGRLDTGAPLPTVRALASRLGTSPATVNAAYRILRQRGLVLGEGRRGTRVAARPPLRTPSHHRPEAHGLHDLAVGMPDPALLPALGPALARIDLPVTTQLDGLEIADPRLLELARKGFAADGVDVGGIAVVGGAFDGIERVLGAHLRPGDRVIIEDPAYVSIRDLLLALGLVAVPVPVDDLGLIPERLAEALAKGAQAAVIVPRAQNPVGAAFDDRRADELRRLLEPHPELLIVEDDHAGIVSGAPFLSLTKPGRPHWAVIRSVSKFLHPDLRLAVMAGDETTIARVEGRQALGPRWSSHVLQAIVVELVLDPGFPALIARAREAYAARRRGMVEALAAQGIQAHGNSGLNVWVPVREEAATVRALQEAGWLVLAGERFRIATPPGIRITVTTLLPGEDQAIAAALAAVEHAGRPRRVY
ncbi:MAG TPA: aminotransferase class I/II-fold pyridoxal phosphate-dependent enzyme [Solirubrobacteraceae bacterium]|jgi:DNA-binding transcriptional MocR family regulator|nr:aminotransferase class I/II-fold pyridoxal phosphate-dependent enzyme [Solirubrobacteraceae bacterium]